MAIPVATLSMVGLAFSPILAARLQSGFGLSPLKLNFLTVGFCGFFWVMFELASIPASTIYGALINDVVPKNIIGRFYGLFRALSLLAGIIFNYYLMGNAENHYILIFLGIGLIYGVGFTIMCLQVKEGEYPPPAPIDRRLSTGWWGVIQLSFRECFSNPYYLWVFLALSTETAFLPVNLFSLIFAKSLNMDLGLYGRYIALTYLISFVLSYFLGALADRLHPLRVGGGILGMYALVALWGGIYARDASSFAIALVLHGVLSGALYTSNASMAQRLYPHFRYGQFASAGAMLANIFRMLLAPAVGVMLDITGHNYRYTFLASFVLAVSGAMIVYVTYRKFLLHGGVKNYVAPE
jgi:hypothetical protein